MGLLKLVINTRESSDTNSAQFNPIANDVGTLGRLTNWMQGLKTRGGSFLTIESGGVQASGTFTISPNAADADTAVIAGVTLTAKTTPTLAAHFQIGPSLEDTAKNLVDKINSLSTVNIFVVAGNVAGVVTVAATTQGDTSDAITTTATGNIAAGAATLASGASGTVTNIELGRSATA